MKINDIVNKNLQISETSNPMQSTKSNVNSEKMLSYFDSDAQKKALDIYRKGKM